MASRLVEHLSDTMIQLCLQHLKLCDNNQVLRDKGVHVFLTCTYRSDREQDDLYAQGRVLPGPIVTNARGGQSKHNVYTTKPAAEAYDIGILENGKLTWDDSEAWEIVGNLGLSIGLVWYGVPGSRFKEKPHFQNPNA